ncbi:MAG: ribonuclease [Clostridiales bacterium]|nr:ribonuclease [Clostridiales bacterium]
MKFKREKKTIISIIVLLCMLVISSIFTGCDVSVQDNTMTQQSNTAAPVIDEDGTYSSKEDVALYIHTYGHLPSNYVTKVQAQQQGWDNKEGNLWDVFPGKSIGGDHFGNYEGKLPAGHSYKECDIDFDGGYRNAKRIIYSDDGLIFYTEDHYNTFEQLY